MDEKITRLEEKTNKIEQKSFALEMIEFAKEQTERTNKRLFIIIIILIIGLICSIAYNIYQAQDTETITDTLEIQDVETIDNSHIKIGDDLWEKSK